MKKKIIKFIALALVLTLATPNLSVKAAVNKPAKATTAPSTVAPKLNASKATITGVGTKYVLVLTAPAKSKATWKSSKASVATVNANGIVTAKTKGTAAITCTVKTGKQTKKLTCNVTVKVPSKAVRFSNAKIDTVYNAQLMDINATYDFNATLISSSTKSQSSDIVRFSISDSSIATVDPKTGVVTAKKAGDIVYLTVAAGATEAAALDPNNTKTATIGIKVVSQTVSVANYTLNNSKELAVKFNRPMNGATMFDSNHNLLDSISISLKKSSNGTLASDLGTITGYLSDDKQTLYIRTVNPFKGDYVVELKGTILSDSGIALTPYRIDSNFDDKTKPIFAGYSTDDSGLIVTIKFSEPINATNLVAQNPKKTVNGSTSPVASTTVFTTASNYKLSADKTSLVIDLSSIASTDKNCDLSVELAGITDLAGNPTDPYPLIAYMKTDTSAKPQVTCQGVMRNGNSLVATFSSSIQSPGYAIVNNYSIAGTANPNNKKEVIYDLNYANLTTLTGSVAVTITGFSGYNSTTSTSASQFSTSVYFNTNVVLPSITKSSLTTKQINGVKQNVLTLTYDKNVSLKNASGTLSATNILNGVITPATNYPYTATVVDNEVTIVLSGNFTEQTTYTFTLPAQFIKDVYNNYSAAQSVSVTKITGEDQAMPGPVAIQLDSNSTNTIYVTFGNMVDLTTAQTISNYSISGLTVTSATVLPNNYIVELKLASASTVSSIPYVVTISGIKGYNGSYSAMNTYQATVNISNNKVLQAYCTGSASTKKITLTVANTINTASVINYSFTCNGKDLTLKAAPVITGSNITFEFNDTIAANSTVIMSPAVTNSIFDINNQKILNQSYSVLMN